MKNFVTKLKTPEGLVALLVLASLIIMYRDVLLAGKILFPSNFLASYYSPWATQKFSQFPTGIPNKPIGGNDQVRMFYPYRTFSTESLKRGELPLWNPYSFSGSPLLANFQSAIFYPFNLLYLVLPQITAWSVLVVVQPIMGTLFMYVFLRLFIKRKIAAFFGAFSFGFSGFILAWSQENAVVAQTALWLPAVLYTTEKFIQTTNKKTYLFLVISLVTCFLAGHYQFAFYVFTTSFLYGLMRIYQSNNSQKLKTVIYLFGAYLSMLCICAIQLLPSIEAFTQGPRSSVFMYPIIKVYLMPATHFIQAIAPDILGNPGSYNYFGRGFYQESIFYAGTITFVFALFAIRYFKQNQLIRFFTFLLAITYLFAIDSPFTHWFNQLPIPIITTFSPSRILFLTSAALSVLSAFGFEYWLEDTNKRTKFILSTIAILSAACIGIDLIIMYLSVHTPTKELQNLVSFIIKPPGLLQLRDVNVAIRNSLLPLGMLCAIVMAAFVRKWAYLSWFLVILMCAGQLYFMNKYLVIGEPSLLYPDHFVFDDIQKNQGEGDRFLSFGLPILGDVNVQKHTFSPDGIDPVFPSRYGQLLYSTKIQGKFTRNTPQIEANLSEYGENLNIIDNPSRLRLMSLLGVKRVYNYEPSYKNLNDLPKIFPARQFTSLWQKLGWHAYENTRAFPRVFLADKYEIKTDPQGIINRIFDPTLNLRKTLILEEQPEDFTPANPSASSGTATILSYQPQMVKIKTSSESNNLLFLSDNYYPGWKAYVDGYQTKIYRADYTFRAIMLPQGEHTVEFKYQPTSVYAGAVISALACLIVAAGFIFKARHRGHFVLPS